MATPDKPEASGDSTDRSPLDGIEDAEVMAGPDRAETPQSPDNLLETQELPASDAIPEPAPWAAAEARLAELTGRVAAAERAAAARPEPEPARGGTPLPGIVGGLIAAAIGFGAAQIVPQGWPIGDTTDLRATVATQGTQLADLGAQVAALPAPQPPPDMAPVEAQLAALADRVAAAEAALAALPAPPDPAPQIAALEARIAEVDPAPALDAMRQALAAFEARIATVEAMPPGTVVEGADPAATLAVQQALTALQGRLAALEAAPPQGGADPAALAALQDQVTALRADLSAQDAAAAAAVADVTAAAETARAALAEAEAEAARLKDAASAATQAAAAEAALGRLTAALETGAPFTTAADDLAAAGHSLPPALADHAATGLPTLAALQDSFPDAARAALDAALKAGMDGSAGERIAAFLRTQVGVRSLEPREGDDPDAVLSRAEAALAAGDLDGALAETAALPEAGLAAMAGWVAQATLRRDAGAALADLTAAVGG
jgi:hypothetical protein